MPEKRKQGRPKPGRRPKVDYRQVDKLLVSGEQDPGDKKLLVYPSYAELAERYGVSKSTIAQYASRHNCTHRRKNLINELQAKLEQKLIEIRTDPRALAIGEVVGIIDAYVRLFAQRVHSGEIRADNPADVDRLLRLKEFLLGNADSRTEVTGHISLEAIQTRHKQTLAILKTTTPEIRGEVTEDAEIDRKDELEVEPQVLELQAKDGAAASAKPAKPAREEDPTPSMAAV